MSESLKLKLQKLLTLSKRGVDGEKLNAEFHLKRLLKKHNISISEIESDVREKRYYPYTTNESQKLYCSFAVLVFAFVVQGDAQVFTGFALVDLVLDFAKVSGGDGVFHFMRVLELILEVGPVNNLTGEIFFEPVAKFICIIEAIILCQ